MPGASRDAVPCKYTNAHVTLGVFQVFGILGSQHLRERAEDRILKRTCSRLRPRPLQQEHMNTSIKLRSSIRPGMSVLVVLKQDQPTGKLTQGIVKDVLTRSASHPHGIKVRLQSGLVGRVQQIVEVQSG